jgi:tRNA(adenine34) deaminase
MNELPQNANTDADLHWMQRAIALAALAAERGEVPVGAVLVRHGELIGEGFNQPISAHDPTAHAEIVALRAAAAATSNYRLPETTLYVSLEPCTMCIGAMIHARVGRLVFATREPRAGAVCSQHQLCDHPSYNHKLAWSEGVMATESSALLTAFFKARR